MTNPIHQQVRESDLQAAIIEYATMRGWRLSHFRPARTNRGWRTAITGDKGFPDLTLVRGDRLVFIECKAERGRMTRDQMAWGDALTAVPGVEWWVVRPSLLDRAYRLLD